MVQQDERDTLQADDVALPAQDNENLDGASTDIAVMTEDEPESAAVRPKRSRPFSEMLVEAGMLSQEQVIQAQEAAVREGLQLARVLVRDGLVMSRDLAAFTALHLGLTMVDLRGETLEPEVVAQVPEETSIKYNLLPLRRTDGRMTVAMSDPTDLQAIQDLTVSTGCAIDPVVAEDAELREHIEIAYKMVSQTAKESADGTQAISTRLTADQLRTAQPTRFVEMLLEQAYHDGASDIHIEPSETRLRLRFRIDGILQETMQLPLDIHPTLISRIKIKSGMNIAERRRPQDGQLSFEAEDKRIDVRAAVCNTVYGEMAVLRILDSGNLAVLGLDQLGMSEGLDKYREMVKLPYGMILVAGPTGSGKTTTLAASIMTVNRSEMNVITMEDPVENELPDANQLQVHTDSGVTFAVLLRSILRLDPDVILVGEIRDKETAELATESALTGHLVFSTVHANDCVSTLLRMKDLGVPAYLISSALAGIVAQRMVRKVCTGCAAMQRRPVAEQAAFADVMGETRERFIYGAGCNLCAHTGYKGRSGIYEIMEMTDGLREAFLADAPRHVLWEQTIKEGTIPLRKDGMIKVQKGITTPYEVMRTAME